CGDVGLMNIGQEYIKVVQERFRSVKDLGDKTILQLSEDELHWALNETSNSIAIIVKHLGGNMISRWTDFLTTDGEKPDRNRDQEFIDNLPKKEMLLNWEEGWNVLFAALAELT